MFYVLIVTFIFSSEIYAMEQKEAGINTDEKSQTVHQSFLQDQTPPKTQEEIAEESNRFVENLLEIAKKQQEDELMSISIQPDPMEKYFKLQKEYKELEKLMIENGGGVIEYSNGKITYSPGFS